MSKLIITYNGAGSSKFTVEEHLSSPSVEIAFHFMMYALRIDISDLRVSLRVYRSGGEPQIFHFPEEGTRLQSTDQTKLFSTLFHLEKNTLYYCQVELAFADRTEELNFNFLAPYPLSPYASWVWSDEEDDWRPPVPSPGVMFVWDEGRYQDGLDPWVPVGDSEF